MYIQDFDSFINEGLMDNGNIIKETFIKKGSRTVIVKNENGKTETITIEPGEVIKTVEDAVDSLSFDFGSFFDFVSEFTIIYFWFDKHCKTMCVDDHMNIYISVPFVKVALEMNKELIRAVIMHEILHVAFNHLERGKRWLVSQNKPFNKETAHDNNLAADIEVNLALISKRIISFDNLVSKIKGLYLDEYSANVPPMEVVLEDERAMQKLRSLCPLEDEEQQPRENKKIKTSEEFDKGYVEMKNKITELVNKYGVEKAIEKLREIGALSGVKPTISDDIDFDDVLGMSFVVLKTFEEFINESKETESSEGYSTKEDGYREAIKKSLGEMLSALNQDGIENGEDGEDGENGDDSNQEIETGINQDDLEPMNLPGKKQKGKKSNGKPFPSNVNQNGDNGDEGDEGDEGDDSGSGDNENENKTSDGEKNTTGKNAGSSKNNGFGKNGRSEIEISFGGSKTGEFTDSKSNTVKSLKDTIKDSYGKDFEKIMDVIKENTAVNTKEMIKKKCESAFNSLSSQDSLKLIWKKSKDNEKKYKAMWKKILNDFLYKKTRRAGEDIRDNRIKWGERRRLSIGMMSPKYLKKAQENQDLNAYIDISGSVDMKLLELVAQSLVVFLKEYQYSGINIIPWGDNSNGSYRVSPISKVGKERAADEIISYINKGINELSRGTSLRKACVPEMITNIQKIRNRENVDDIHIVISDGDTGSDQKGIEKFIYSTLTAKENPNRVDNKKAQKAIESCIWMLYDCRDEESWKQEIKNGRLVFISSKNFIPE